MYILKKNPGRVIQKCLKNGFQQNVMTRVLSPGNKFVLPLQSRACFYSCTTRRITPFYFVISSCARCWMHSGNLLHSAKTDDDTLLSYNRRSHSACRALSVCILMFGTFFKALWKNWLSLRIGVFLRSWPRGRLFLLFPRMGRAPMREESIKCSARCLT